MNDILRLAQEAFPHICRTPDKTLLERLDAQRDDLTHALETTSGVERLELAVAVWRFWLERGYFQEGRTWLVRALEGAADAPAKLRAEALHGAGVLSSLIAEYEEAHRYLVESLALWEAAGVEQGRAKTLNELGTLARERGNYEEARSYHDQSLQIWRKLGDHWGIATGMNNLGIVAWSLGDLSEGHALLFEAVYLYRSLGDQSHLAQALNNLANLTYQSGNYAAARITYEECLPVLISLGNRMGEAIVLHNLGECCYQQGDSEIAMAYLRDSLRLRQELGRFTGMWLPVVTLANIARHYKDFTRATRLLGAAEALRESYGMPIPPAELPIYEADVAAVRKALTQESFERLWAEGTCMSLEELMTYAFA